jgi:hypothetical protein
MTLFFVIQNQVNILLGALASVVNGGNSRKQPVVDDKLELDKLKLTDNSNALVDLSSGAIAPPNALADLPNASFDALEDQKTYLTPWLPSIEDRIAGLTLTPTLDFSCPDQHSIAGSGNETLTPAVEIRDFGDFAANFAPVDSDARIVLTEGSLTEEDFSHAIDQTGELRLPIWENTSPWQNN